MKTTMCFAVAAVAVGMASAQPEVSGVVVKDGTARRVRVQYALSEDAVVTARFKVGGAWIAGDKVTALSGDICRKVAATKAGETRSFTWNFAAEGDDAIVAAATQAEVELTAWSTNAPPDYMTIALQSPYAVNYYADAASVPLGVTNALYKTTKMLFRKIPAAGVTFCMGANYNSVSCAVQSGHPVILTRDYYMAVYMVTRKQMELIGGYRTNGGPTSGENDDWIPSNGREMSNVRGLTRTPEATTHLGKLAANSGVASLDLPTEAQWEFAANAGVGSLCSAGSISAAIDCVAWTSQCTDGYKMHAVGTKEPNGYGLYDMYGNLFELCLDAIDSEVRNDGEPMVDPLVFAGSEKCVGKGGCYAYPRVYVGVGVRMGCNPQGHDWSYGYRVCCDAAAY